MKNENKRSVEETKEAAKMFETIKNQFSAFVQDEEGASMVEYILLVALIAVVAAVGFKTLGQGIAAKTTQVNDNLK